MTRSAADIGAGLEQARPARAIRTGERIHVVGAAGAGASAAALLAAGVGASVTACDPGAPSPYTAALVARGIAVAPKHDPAHVAGPAGPSVDRLAVSKALTAVAPDHPELAAARAVGIPLEAWQQLVADAAVTAGQMLVGVAGTHGKSTSTAWLLEVLVAAGRDPSGFVGALMAPTSAAEPASTARLGRGDLCIVEADEYAANFDPYRPTVAILLNAEWDHPDVFVDEAAVLAAFDGWIRAMEAGPDGRSPTVVVNIADPGAAIVAAGLHDWSGTVVRVALRVERGGVRAADLTDGTPAAGRPLGGSPDLLGSLVANDSGVDILEAEGPLTGRLRIEMRLPGRHNAANALCVAAAAAILGVPGRAIVAGLERFQGVGRRLEVKGEPGGVLVLDDYGHHPSAIRASLATVRARYPGRPVWAVYEPLTYHRTAAMLDAFADVLATADHAVIADIWAGRDPDRTIASATELAAAISTRSSAPALATGSPEATADHLASLVHQGDVVLVMGGGRSYVIADRLVERLAVQG
ncbi:MAG: cyanophycin synthetase [Candidatus Limnocylindrales bacterium]